MNHTTIDSNETEDVALTYEVSDDELEAAGGGMKWSTFGCTGTHLQPYCQP